MMRNIKLLLILAFFSAAVTAAEMQEPVNPEQANVVLTEPAVDTLDPTLAFFAALSSCIPGTYTEKNILTAEVGQPNLPQKIIGMSDDKLTCNAILTTPDNRVLTCAFPMFILPQLNDQHFLEGILEGTADSPSQNSINADILWSKIKAESCELNQ